MKTNLPSAAAAFLRSWFSSTPTLWSLRPRPAYSTAALAILAASLSILLSACGGGGTDQVLVAPPAQGQLQTTFRTMDLAVDGPEMFATLDEATGEKVYSRFGRFDIDAKGNLVHADGGRLIGFQQWKSRLSSAMSIVIGPLIPNDPVPLAPVQLSLPNTATTWVHLEINLNAGASVSPSSELQPYVFDPSNPETFANATGKTVYDRAGNAISLNFYFAKIGLDTWTVYLTANGVIVDWNRSFKFRPGASLYAVALENVDIPSVPIGPDAMSLPMGKLVMSLPVRQTMWQFTVESTGQDGYVAGRLDGVTVSSLGNVLVHYSNGAEMDAGQIALAAFGKDDRLGKFGAHGWTCRDQCVAPDLDVGMLDRKILSGRIEIQK